MKRGTKVALTAAVLLMALAAVALAVSTQKPAPASTTSCDTYRQALKDAKIEATYTTDGVTVKITTNTPESVQLLQSFWQECGRYHLLGTGCPCDSANCDTSCGSGCGTTGSQGFPRSGDKCGGQGTCPGHR